MKLILRISALTLSAFSISCTQSAGSKTQNPEPAPVVASAPAQALTSPPAAPTPSSIHTAPSATIATPTSEPAKTSESSEPKRIQLYQARFDSSTPAERKLIRLGEVAVGFDQDQVRMALGEPDRTTTVDTSNGTSIAWEYLQREDPSVGLSIGGLLRSGGKLSTGAGVNVNTNLRKTKLQKLVIFDQQSGQVRKIETYE